MSYLIIPKGFLSLCTAIFIFSFINQVNFYEIFNMYQQKGLSHNEIDYVEIMEFLAVIAGGIVLTQIINKSGA